MRRWFRTASGAFHQALELLLLRCYYLPWLWGRAELLSQLLAAHTPGYRHGEIGTTIIFFLLDGAKDTLLGLPFSLYSTFVVEQRHGFNKQTLALFLVDVLKSARPPPLHRCMHAAGEFVE
jgi:STE24 endopeptidase